MNYIINPMIFYWMEISETLKLVFIITGFVAVLVAFITWMIALTDSFTPDEELKTAKKKIKLVVIAGVVCLLTGVFLPSKETILSILIAKLATTDNINITVDGIKSAVDYIVEAAKAIG